MNIIFTSNKETYKNIRRGTEILLSESDIFTENIELSVEFQDRPEIAISKNGNQIHVICREAAHYYRALNYVLHHMEDKTFQYQEHIYFERNGLMLDCSRNAVFTVEKVKFLIRILAKLGMNVLMLYTEDTYEVKSEPYFGAYRGKYTRDEIREIDTYAAMFGIELVPCIQTLAHLHNALKWPEMSEIRDSADILQPGKEETYQFIEKLLISVKENFSTSRVHLGMDEAVMLGLGNSLRENGYKEGSLLIREHCDRVMDICKTLGLKPMIWSDMYITANTRGGYYDVPENADCSQWEKPDRNLGLVYWDYYHDDIRDYEKMLDIHEQLSDNIIFAGGSWIWNGISPNYSKTFACTNAALGACKEYDMKEVLCTAWMDNGAETPVDALLPGVALFAHLGFHKEYDESILKEEFKNCTGGELDDFMELDRFDSLFLNEKGNQEAQNPSKYLLYQDPMLGIFDYHVKASGTDIKAYYQEIYSCMSENCTKSAKYGLVFSFYEKLAAVLAGKADLGVRIKDAYDREEKEILKEISHNEIPDIICNLEEMKRIREEIWMTDAKPFGYELLDVKLGGVITRLKSTGHRIDDYLNGKVSRLEELEETRLPYFTGEMDKRENRWDRIISGCDLNDTI